MQKLRQCCACMLTCEVPLIQPSAAALHPQQETYVSIHHQLSRPSRQSAHVNYTVRPAFEIFTNYVKMMPQRNKQLKSHQVVHNATDLQQCTTRVPHLVRFESYDKP